MYVRKAKGLRKHYDFVISDVIVLTVSLVLAYFVRHGVVNPYKDVVFRNATIFMFFVDLVVIAFCSIYSGVLKRSYAKEFFMVVFQSLILLAMSTFILFFLKQSNSITRRFSVYSAGIYLILEFSLRVILKSRLEKKGVFAGKNSMLLVVTKDEAEQIIAYISQTVEPTIHICGVAIIDGKKKDEGSEINGLKVVATKDNFIDYVTRAWIDEVFFILPEGVSAYDDLIEEISQSGITTHVSLGKAESRIGHKQRIENIDGYTVLTTSINQLTFRQAFLKRSLDILGGLVGSFFAVIAIFIFGPIIYIKSPGPILFKQKRVGCNGKVFNFIKIRSMVMNADAKKAELMEQNRVKDGMMFKLDFDPRIIGAKILPDGTKKKGIGNFIRDWSIDELPQFFNVLFGDMSLVGTRPPTMDEWEKYKLHHRARLAFKPGITGLWQVSGRSDIKDFEEVVKLDTKYIMDWSFALDIRILFKTVKAVLKREGSM